MLRGRQTCVAMVVLFTTVVQANILGDWINNPGYLQGGTPKEQIRCYVLPYGALGFITHLLTSYCVACLARGRSPWHPGSRLQRPKLDIVLAMAGLMISLFINMLVVFKCWNSWEFILIAVWKVFLSLTLSAITPDAGFRTLRRETLGNTQMRVVCESSRHRTRTAFDRFLDNVPKVLLPCMKKRQRPRSHASGSVETHCINTSSEDYPKTLRWLFLELAGTIAGCTGLFALMQREDFEQKRAFWAISLAFGLTSSSVFGGAIMWSYKSRMHRRKAKHDFDVNECEKKFLYQAGRNGRGFYGRPTQAPILPPQPLLRQEEPGAPTPIPVSHPAQHLPDSDRLRETEDQLLLQIEAIRRRPLLEIEDLPMMVIQVLVFAIVTSCLVAALYSDWILAYTSGSWSGIPSTDNMFVSLIYMASKLMPLFQS